METASHAFELTSLSDWSFRHIRDVFESRTDQQALQAITATFSDNVSATVNGMPLGREGINQMVLAMRKTCSSGGLKVQWQKALEAPRDRTNRGGSFNGSYVIRGIQKTLPGSSKPVEFERHKTVSVQIESQSSSQHHDSRRIVSLAFIASDLRVDRQASL